MRTGGTPHFRKPPHQIPISMLGCSCATVIPSACCEQQFFGPGCADCTVKQTPQSRRRRQIPTKNRKLGGGFKSPKKLRVKVANAMPQTVPSIWRFTVGNGDDDPIILGGKAQSKLETTNQQRFSPWEEGLVIDWNSVDQGWSTQKHNCLCNNICISKRTQTGPKYFSNLQTGYWFFLISFDFWRQTIERNTFFSPHLLMWHLVRQLAPAAKPHGDGLAWPCRWMVCRFWLLMLLERVGHGET